MLNNYNSVQSTQREKYEQKYKISRGNLLLVVVFTAINLLLLATNSNTYFLFSAFIPYCITATGMLLCGRFPDEFYTDGVENMAFFSDSLFVAFLLISIGITLLYLLAWFMSSKNRVGWMIFSLVFFGLDTIGMLLINGISTEEIFDILFHAWVIYYLVIGITSHYKLKKLPPDGIQFPVRNAFQSVEGAECNFSKSAEGTPNSYIIRKADKEVKHRVLLEARTLNYDICYRRVKQTNELVINGNVYDEIPGVMEYPHTLKAWIDGHYISASFTGTHSVISVDGEETAKKLRLF